MAVQEKKSQLSAAVVGCGTIAPIHLNALLSANIKINALCDIDIKKAAALKERFSLDSAVSDDYYALIKNKTIDCVHICTPHNLHANMIIAALENNINVFVEKPLAVNEDEIVRIQAAAKKSNGKVGVCFQNRYLPSNVKVKELADGNMTTDAFFSVIWSRGEEYFKEAPWRGQLEESGGGALINQGIHTLDLLVWFLGDPKFITASISNYKKLGAVEDAVSGLIEFDCGVVPFHVTTASITNQPINILLKGKKLIEINGVELSVDGTKKCFDEHSGQKLIKKYWGNGHIAIIKDFYNCLRSGTRFAIDEVEGARALKAVLKIYESNGKRINF